MRIYILPEVHAEIMHYVHKSPVEISGLGRITRSSTGEMVVTKIYLLKQENAATSTDLCKDAVATLQYESREDVGDLNFWWHSHVNMAAFWSGTDMATIREFGKNGYLLSTVFNKKGEYQTAYFQGQTDFLPEVFIDKLETNFSYLPTKAQMDAWDAEFKAKATEKKWVAPVQGIHSAHKGGYDHWRGMGYSGREWDGWEDDLYGAGSSTSAPVPTTGKQTYYAEKIISPSTGATLAQAQASVKNWYFKRPCEKAEDLEIEDCLLLFDLYEVIHGRTPSVDEQETFYTGITSSWSGCMQVFEDLEDAVEYEQDVMMNVTTSRKGKQKIKGSKKGAKV